MNLRYLKQSLIFLSVFLMAAAYGAVPEKPQIAPIKPASSSSDYGLMTPRMDLDHVHPRMVAVGRRGTRQIASALPARFDWRETGKVSSIKNQSVCGACYSFAGIANIESRLLITEGTTYDFSENNAKECNYWDRSCGGGSCYDLADLFSKKGTILESCDPYVASDVSCNSSCTPQKVLLDWLIISTSTVPDDSILKSYIYNYGPVYTTYYAGDGNDPSWDNEMSTYDGSYTMYYTGTYQSNHAVLIVGWDDDLVHAGGTGGWIVKNSWGTSWGGTCGYGAEGGYFYIAYGSANIGTWSAVSVNLTDYDSTQNLYYYDEGGWMTQMGYGNPTCWAMSKFTPVENTKLTRVEFWTTDATTDIDVYVYDDFNTTSRSLSNLLGYRYDTSFAEPGYHSIDLVAPADLTSGDPIFVAVKFTDESYNFPVVCDDTPPIETATTYLSSNGASGSWYELGSGLSIDGALRIRTDPSLVQSNDDDPETLPNRFRLEPNYPNPFNPITTIVYSVEQRTHVNIAVYNMIGQKVAVLVDNEISAGEHSVQWNGCDADGRPVATGVYFYRIETEQYRATRKMVLLK